jgi:hypothetical protein
MKPNCAVLALLVPVALAALGCAEDVGPCPDDGDGGPTAARGFDTVVVGSSVQYGGQAIMNVSCAGGVCHSSIAKGSARRGAPADLNFDLVPVSESNIAGTGMNMSGRKVATLSDEDRVGLRERQRKVFEERNRIWQQVKDDLMPPDGIYAMFKQLTRIHDSKEDAPCSGSRNSYADITQKSSQDILRKWLACQAPIVEVNASVVEVNGSAGRAGFQYQVCGDTPIDDDAGSDDGGAGDAGAEEGGAPTTVVTLEDLLDGVFTDNTCTSCHPTVNKGIDLSSADKAYATLVTNKAVICNGKPFVTPGDPSKSFLIDILGEENDCKDPMPPSGKMSAAEIKQVTDWIQGGAKRDADKGIKTVLPRDLVTKDPSVGLDAGL